MNNQAIITKIKGVPRTILGVTSLRRNPQKAFDLARKKGMPILVTELNKPQGIIIPLEVFDEIVDVLNTFELKDALDSVKVYKTEKKQKNLRELKSLEDLTSNEN